MRQAKTDWIPPTNWTLCTLNEVVSFVRGVNYKKGQERAEPSERSVPLLRGGNIQDGQIVLDDLVHVPSELVSPQQLLRPGDVVITMSSGSARLVGKAAPVSPNSGSLTFGAFCGCFRPFSSDITGWVGAFFQTQAYRNAVSQASAGVNINNLRSGTVLALPFLTPPLGEQHRILAKLEELFSELDAGMAALHRAQRRLTRYHQALLQAAVTGELTREWREQKAHSIKPRNPEEGLCSWTIPNFGSLISRIEAGKNFTAKGVPPGEGETGIVKISAVTWNTYDEHESKTVTRAELIDPRRFINLGDFLFSRANTLELVGACVIVHRVTKPIMISDKVLRIHFRDESLKPWTLAFFKSATGRRELEARASGNQLSMRNISQAKLVTIPIPIPPAEERLQILTELDRRLSAVEVMEATIQNSLRRAERLRQSILERAFRGELVPQDPNDETAEALLARMRAAATEAPTLRRRGHPPKAAIPAPLPPRRRGRPKTAAPTPAPNPRKRGRPRKAKA